MRGLARAAKIPSVRRELGAGARRIDEDEIAQRPAAERDRLFVLLGAYRAACSRIDVTEGLTAAEHESDRPRNRANALLTLWLDTPATTVEGITLKLRCARYYHDREADPLGDAILAALADAERLGMAPVSPTAHMGADMLAHSLADIERLAGSKHSVWGSLGGERHAKPPLPA